MATHHLNTATSSRERSDGLADPPVRKPNASSNVKLKCTALDLFSGCGGTTAGLKEAGFHVHSAVEIDEHNADCYRHNHPEVILHTADIQRLDPASIWISPHPPDLIAACPPCQGFSDLRTRKTEKVKDDPRNRLYLEFLRFVETLNPKNILLENVPRFAIGGRFRFMLHALKQQGYNVAYGIVDAANYGVPQRRRRLVVIGTRSDSDILSVFSKEQKRLTVRDALSFQHPKAMSFDELHNLSQKFSDLVMDRIRSVPAESTRKRAKNFLPLNCHSRMDGFQDVYGRMKWDQPAPTITSGIYTPSKGRFLHPTEDRCISLREAALLQGFERNYVFPSSLGKMRIAAMIGNAAPPPMIEAFASKLYGK